MCLLMNLKKTRMGTWKGLEKEKERNIKISKKAFIYLISISWVIFTFGLCEVMV